MQEATRSRAAFDTTGFGRSHACAWKVGARRRRRRHDLAASAAFAITALNLILVQRSAWQEVPLPQVRDDVTQRVLGARLELRCD